MLIDTYASIAKALQNEALSRQESKTFIEDLLNKLP